MDTIKDETLSQSTQLEAQLAAQQIVINNLRQWLSDTQLQLAEAVANVHLKDQLIQQLQNKDPTE